MLKKLLALFGFKSTPGIQMEIKFHHDANYFGEHGTLVVTHMKKNIIEQPVRFVFIGMVTPPAMSLPLMNYLWQEALNQGYIPHYIHTYGKENEIINAAGLFGNDTPIGSDVVKESIPNVRNIEAGIRRHTMPLAITDKQTKTH